MTAYKVEVDRLDSDGRTIGTETVSTGIYDPVKAKEVAAKWDISVHQPRRFNCNMLYGRARVVPVETEVPAKKPDAEQPMATIVSTVHFSKHGASHILRALPLVIDNANDEKATYVNYAKHVLHCNTQGLIDTANRVKVNIETNNSIGLNTETKLVMLCGLNLRYQSLFAYKQSITDEKEKTRINHMMNDIITLITQLGGYQE